MCAAPKAQNEQHVTQIDSSVAYLRPSEKHLVATDGDYESSEGCCPRLYALNIVWRRISADVFPRPFTL